MNNVMKTKNDKVNDPKYFEHVIHMSKDHEPLCRAQGGGDTTNVFAHAVNCNKCLKVMERGKK